MTKIAPKKSKTALRLRAHFRRKQGKKLAGPAPCDTELETKYALRIANLYAQHVMIRFPRSRIWEHGKSPEESRQFPHFIALARIVLQTKNDQYPIDYRWWVQAQFEAWNGPSGTYPMPNMLHSEGAFTRWNQWLALREERPSVIAAEVNAWWTDEHRLKAGELKLRRFVECMQCSERKALIVHHREFTEWFLKHKGVWDRVRDRWLEARGAL